MMSLVLDAALAVVVVAAAGLPICYGIVVMLERVSAQNAKRRSSSMLDAANPRKKPSDVSMICVRVTAGPVVLTVHMAAIPAPAPPEAAHKRPVRLSPQVASSAFTSAKLAMAET